jgi:ribokinase
MNSKENPQQGSVIVVGGISIDLVAFADKLPAPGESILGDDFKIILGGKGSNQAVAASLAGVQSTLVSCVGTDVFTGFATEALEGFGVDTAFVRQVEGPTGIAHIRVAASSQNNIVVIPLANFKITKPQVDEAFDKRPNAKVLLTQLEIPWEVNRHAISLAKSQGLIVVLDPAPASNPEPTAWELINIVTPNESEAHSLTGIEVTDEQSAKKAGNWFLDQGVENAIITMGGSGVVLVNKQETRMFAAPKVQAVDTTAAGDAFAGYLGAMLSEGASLEEAIGVAVKAASISVTKLGASSSLPTRDQVSQQNFGL